MTRSMKLFVALAAAAALSCGAAARAAVPAGQPVDGIRCDQMEGSLMHIHQHLRILDHGKPVAIPDDIGRPMIGQCFYWIHTHTPDGLIHVESPAFRTFTLGNFFDVWGQPLSATRLADAHFKKGDLRTYVNGHVFSGNPRAIELNQHTDIVLEGGAPYASPTPFTDWQGQ